VLDAGLKLISANPPAIDPQDGWIVLVNIATEGSARRKLAGPLSMVDQAKSQPDRLYEN